MSNPIGAITSVAKAAAATTRNSASPHNPQGDAFAVRKAAEEFPNNLYAAVKASGMPFKNFIDIASHAGIELPKKTKQGRVNDDCEYFTALREAGGNFTAAAKLLNPPVSRVQFHRRMKEIRARAEKDAEGMGLLAVFRPADKGWIVLIDSITGEGMGRYNHAGRAQLMVKGKWEEKPNYGENLSILSGELHRYAVRFDGHLRLSDCAAEAARQTLLEVCYQSRRRRIEKYSLDDTKRAMRATMTALQKWEEKFGKPKFKAGVQSGGS